MVRPQWPYPAAREQTLSDEGGGRSGAGEVAGEARAGQGASPQANAVTDRPPKILHQRPTLSQDGASYERGRCSLRTKVRLPHSCSLWSACRDPTGPTATATARSRIRPVMQAAKPVAEPDRDAMLKDIAAEFGQHEVVGSGLLHRIISEVQRRYDVADQRRTTAQKREDPGWM